MRTEQNGSQDPATLSGTFEEAASFGFGPQDEEYAKSKKLVAMPIFLPRKDAGAMDEQRIRRLKKGEDVSRSQFIAEAIRMRIGAESSSKSPVRNA